MEETENQEMEAIKAELEALKKKNEELNATLSSEKIALAEAIAGKMVLRGDIDPAQVGEKARELATKDLKTLVRLHEDVSVPVVHEENSYETKPSLARARADFEELIRNANVDQLIATAHKEGIL